MLLIVCNVHSSFSEFIIKREENNAITIFEVSNMLDLDSSILDTSR